MWKWHLLIHNVVGKYKRESNLKLESKHWLKHFHLLKTSPVLLLGYFSQTFFLIICHYVRNVIKTNQIYFLMINVRILKKACSWKKGSESKRIEGIHLDIKTSFCIIVLFPISFSMDQPVFPVQRTDLSNEQDVQWPPPAYRGQPLPAVSLHSAAGAFNLNNDILLWVLQVRK